MTAIEDSPTVQLVYDVMIEILLLYQYLMLKRDNIIQIYLLTLQDVNHFVFINQ